MIFLLFLYFVGISGQEYTLPGECPDIPLQMKLDYSKFSGLWYHAGAYASDGEDIHDCATLYFRKDSLWYTLRETYVDGDKDNRTQLSYSVMLHTHHHPNDSAQYMAIFKHDDKLLEFPLSILSTDYDSYAILYVCKWLKEAERKHYIFTWILTRSIEKPHGDTLKKIEDALSKFKVLAEHREEFVFKEFNDATCSFSQKFETDFFSSNIF